jgi:hypothetical protein
MNRWMSDKLKETVTEMIVLLDSQGKKDISDTVVYFIYKY